MYLLHFELPFTCDQQTRDILSKLQPNIWCERNQSVFDNIYELINTVIEQIKTDALSFNRLKQMLECGLL
jgi:5-methylthioribose kinase